MHHTKKKRERERKKMTKDKGHTGKQATSADLEQPHSEDHGVPADLNDLARHQGCHLGEPPNALGLLCKS